MFHAISARLARLAWRIRSRLAISFEYATWYGWQTQQIRPGTCQFRDPRFGQLTPARTTPTGRRRLAHLGSGRHRGHSPREEGS